ncbi:MAG: MarR family transcriptional regulator [Chloroflexi bacterium]|nr:MarR family transcriptional regulator [Chloroflexota bacterium]
MPDAPVDDAPDADRVPDLGGLQVALRRAVQTTIRAQTEPHGLTVEDFGVLNALRARGPGSVRQVARALNYDPTRVSRCAFRLTEEGLLNSERSSQDRRIVTLSLTDRGEALVREMNTGVEDAYRQLLVGSTADDIDGFVNTIQRIRTNFQSMNSA